MHLVEVTDVEHYTPEYFKFKTLKPAGYDFKAGEFAAIGMEDKKVLRAYSFTSAPEDDFLEFYSIKIQDGPLTSKLQHISVGDKIVVAKKTTGTITLDFIKPGGTLWMLATGTGIAPFISLLRHRDTFESFDRIHVVWSVRTHAEHFAYHDYLSEMPIAYSPICTRDEDWRGWSERITELAENRTIIDGDPTDNKVMVCGSPEFNYELKKMLVKRGWEVGKRKSPGTYAEERAFVSVAAKIYRSVKKVTHRIMSS